jgi:hypothetical protein
MAGVFYTPAAEETAAVSVRVAVHSGCTAQLSAPQLRARPPTRSSHAANAAHARMLRLLALTGSPREGLCSAARLASRLGHFDGDGGRQAAQAEERGAFPRPHAVLQPLCPPRLSRTHTPPAFISRPWFERLCCVRAATARHVRWTVGGGMDAAHRTNGCVFLTKTVHGHAPGSRARERRPYNVGSAVGDGGQALTCERRCHEREHMGPRAGRGDLSLRIRRSSLRGPGG